MKMSNPYRQAEQPPEQPTRYKRLVHIHGEASPIESFFEDDPEDPRVFSACQLARSSINSNTKGVWANATTFVPWNSILKIEIVQL